MNDDYTMLEAVVKDDDVEKEIFRAFCEDPSARGCTITPHEIEKGCDAITCGFASEHLKQHFVGKMERLFPGKISWR